MAYCICRIVKLKSGGAISASEHHTRRTRETPNADLSRENDRIIGNIDSSVPLEQEVFARIGQQKIRSDAVLCVEIMLSASPEYFRPDDRGRAGKWNSAQLEEWKRANHTWLIEEYGDKIVRAEMHLDESTPHIHAYFVPLDENLKLNCKSYFGSREKLRKFQDNYAGAMASLGLERGIKGSRATHFQVKHYYAAVTKSPDKTLTTEEIQYQLADRQIVLKQNADLEKTAKSLALRIELLEQEIQSQQMELEQSKQDALNWQDKYQILKSQIITMERDHPDIEIPKVRNFEAQLGAPKTNFTPEIPPEVVDDYYFNKYFKLKAWITKRYGQAGSQKKLDTAIANFCRPHDVARVIAHSPVIKKASATEAKAYIQEIIEAVIVFRKKLENPQMAKARVRTKVHI